MNPKNTPLISVNNLTVEFPSIDGRVTAVNGVSFDIHPGEIVALVGESGSGKSATALAMMRLVELGGGVIDDGSVSLNTDGVARVLTSLSETEMANIRGKKMGMIFQEPMTVLNPALTCGQQITEVIYRHLGLGASDALNISTNILTEVGMDDPVDAMLKYPHQFSGGQKQRILLATALAANPKLVIADEPTTALDSNVKRKINKLIHKVQRERGLAMLYITHDLDSLENFADRVLVMFAGKIVEHGTIEEILNNPIHPYTRGLLACRPPKTGRYYFLPTTDDFMRISTDGKGLQSTAQVKDVFKELEISETDRQRALSKIYKEQPLLKVRDLSKSYAAVGSDRSNRTQAVKKVSLDLYKGETLGLVGSSGCGKTTLGRCIIGLTKPDNGEILLRQRYENVYHTAPALNKIGSRIQYIFQDPYSSLNPRHTIGRALMEPLDILGVGNRKSRKSTVNEMLIKVGLKPYHFDRYPKEFSGGQRQRVAVARALLLEPEIIICDEAVSALDVSVQARVLNLLNELKYEYKLSFIFISHDLDVVRYMSDRIMVMNDGEIIEESESDRLFQNPQEDYTKELLA